MKRKNCIKTGKKINRRERRIVVYRCGILRDLLLLLMLAGGVVNAFCTNSSLDYLNRILNGTGIEADKSMDRLSKVTILLADDPANYAIYSKLEGQIRH